MGRWYYFDATAGLRHLALLREIEKPHARLHALTSEAVAAYGGSDAAAADRLLVEMVSCSQEILWCLKRLQEDPAAADADRFFRDNPS